VGVTEHDYIDAAPLDRDKTITLKQLLGKAAALTISEDDVATLASRLARLDQQLTGTERAELAELAGVALTDVVRRLVGAVDPDHQAQAAEAARESGQDQTAALRELIVEAVSPLASNPPLRERILEIHSSHDVVIDENTVDRLIDVYPVVDPDRAQNIVTSWREYLETHKDEISALHVLYSAEHGMKVTYAELRELAERIKRPPLNWTPDLIWNAYAALEVDPEHPKVRRADRHTVTDLVSLVRFTLGQDNELVPYASTVEEKYAAWLLRQEQAGVTFTERQRWWLDRIADVIAQSAGIALDDLDNAPFIDRGGIDGAAADLGPGAQHLLDRLNEELTA
jgi:type I restriction enzyme R subunit